MASSDGNTVPALEPPEGQTSNFINPPTLMPAVITTAALVYFFATTSVATRLFIKTHVLRAHHIEDFLSYFAWAGLTTYTSLLLYIESYGLARHMWDVPLVELSHMLYYVNILYCIYSPTTAAAKLSALFQIKRIFAVATRDLVWWVVVVSIVLNSIFYLGLFLSYVFECWPREKIWDVTGTVAGKCINGNSSNLAAGILNLISDTEALLLPMWAIWHLQMPIRRKLSVYAVFGVGSLACIIGIGGIYVRVLVLRNADFTWLGTKLALLVISEMAVVIVVGCSPVLPRMYVYLRGPTPSENTPPGNKVTTIGGSERSEGKKSRKRNPLASSLAKYMGPQGLAGMTTLGSTTLATRVGEEDQIQLRPYAGTSSGIWRTVEVDVDQESMMHGSENYTGANITSARAQGSVVFRTIVCPSGHERYWWKTTGCDIANMMAIAAYPEATQRAFLLYYRDALCPLLGHIPVVTDQNQVKSWTWDGSTHEYSFELKKGKVRHAEVRFVIDVSPLRPVDTANPLNTLLTDTLIETFASRVPGFDSTWYRALKRHFDYSHQPANEQRRLAAEAGHLTPILIGFDISRELQAPTMLPFVGKAYFLPCFAAVAKRITRFASICAAIRSLPGIHERPNILSALSMIEAYLNTRPTDWANGARFLGTDLVSPDSTRLKIYLRCPGTSFDDIWDYFTLGGRIPGLDGDKEKYRDFISLLGGNDSGDISCDSSNGGIETANRSKRTTIYFSLDNRYPIPSPKVAFCARNFAENDAVIARGLDTWITKYGWTEKGASVRDQVASVFAHRALAEKTGIFSFIGLARKDPSKPELSIQTYLCPELYGSSRGIIDLG